MKTEQRLVEGERNIGADGKQAEERDWWKTEERSKRKTGRRERLVENMLNRETGGRQKR